MKMRQKLRRSIALTFAFVFASTVLMAGIQPQIASAAPYAQDDINRRAEAWLFGRAIGKCFRESGLRSRYNFDSQQYIKQDDATAGKWFGTELGNTPARNVGTIIGNIVEGDPDDGGVECSNETLVNKAMEWLGMEHVDALCSMGDIFSRKNPGQAGDSCRTGSSDYVAKHWSDDNIQDAWNEVFRQKYLGGKGIEESLTDGMRYWITYETFRLGCKANFKELYKDQSLSGDKKYKTPRYNPQTGEIEQWYVETGDGDDVIEIGGNGLFDDDSKQHCSTMDKNLDDLAAAYKAEVEAGNTPGADTGNGTSVDEGPSCWSKSGPLAWLLCGVLEVVDGGITLLDSWVNNLLFIDADTGYASEGVKNGHAVMRNIALLLLVPMMMFMVIGTALNFGPFDPYTVKKALPRMFVATIFIVLSLPITQFAVELSNTVGQGIGNLIISASGIEISSLGDILGASGKNDTFGGLFLGGAVAASAIISIGVIGSFALVTIVALLIAFVILVMRQVLVMVLIVLAPLAIIVWIFPGNDKLWGIWKGTFTAMLLLYPIIAILIASGRFVASIVGGGN